MTRFIIDDVLDGIARWGAVVRVVVTRTQGSTPRDAGTAMIVGKDDFFGTIGGGRLEFLALKQARELLDSSADVGETWVRETQNFVLGTELRQCCGGVAWLLLEHYTTTHRPELERQRASLTADSLIARPTDHDGAFFNSAQHMAEIAPAIGPITGDGAATPPCLLTDETTARQWFVEPAAKPTTPLIIYGAGHVGRALVRVMQGTPFHIIWVDTDQSRFPQDLHRGVSPVVVTDQADYAKSVAGGAFHVVMTYSHANDLDICRAILQSANSRYLGLIASKTKRAKFLNRLRKDGITDEAMGIFRCPIGLKAFESKEPAVIAISIAAQLITEYEQGAPDVGTDLAGDLNDI